MHEKLVRIEFAGGPDADAEELDRLTISLREELLDLDLRAVDRMAALPAADGAKGPPAAEVAGLIVALSSSTVAALVATVWSWAERNERPNISIRLGDHEITVEGCSASDAKALITSWVNLHDRRHS